MIVRNEGSIPTSELELSKDPLDVMTLAGPKPSTWTMIGHRPVVHCGSASRSFRCPNSPTRAGCWTNSSA